MKFFHIPDNNSPDHFRIILSFPALFYYTGKVPEYHKALLTLQLFLQRFLVSPHNSRNIVFCGGMDAAAAIISEMFRKMAHNVPAVYDGLAARISKCAAFAGRTNCAGGFAWE
jgi:hypothetical protein